MNSYDDEPSYRGRSRSPRQGRDSDYPGGRDAYDGRDAYPGPDAYDARDQYGAYAEPEPTRGASGRATVGRASVGGSAPAPDYGAGPDYGSDYSEPTASGRASVGRASAGRASVPGVAAPASSPSYGEPYGA